MNRGSIVPVYILFIASIVLASVQGARISHMRDSEDLFRWLLNASTQTQLGDSLVHDTSPDLPTPMDDEFFAEASERAAAVLPADLPVDEDLDYDYDGELHPLLVRAVNHEKDMDIWRFAAASENDDLRSKFREYGRKGQLQSLGTQLTTGDLYSADEQIFAVGVTSMFLGMRQIAANFIWLQVDQYWHAGQVHRMVPLMRTCVTLDPNFVDAYLVGAWHMAYNITANIDATPEKYKKLHPKYKRRIGAREEWYYLAADYLKDGVRKNPRDYRLYFDLGFSVYELKMRDHANAVRYIREARRHRHDRWVPRMLGRTLTRNGEYEESIEVWEEYQRIFPDSDIPTEAIRENEGYIAEARYEEYVECIGHAERYLAEIQSDGSAGPGEITRVQGDIQRLRSEADAEFDRAIAIWDELDTQWGNTNALAQKLRMRALETINQKRYLEAVAQLESARWNYPDTEFFDEATQMIIDLKLENNMLLDISEQRAVERMREEEKYKEEYEKPPVINRLQCEYRDRAAESDTSAA